MRTLIGCGVGCLLLALASNPCRSQSLPGDVLTKVKISATAGGFTGGLDNGDEFAHALAALGDLNGDTVGDLAVGAPRDDDGLSNTGAVWILLRLPDGTVASSPKISRLQGGFTGQLDSGDEFGSALANIGDVNGDGVTDLAVGAPLDDDGGIDNGAVWILFLDPFGRVQGHQKLSETQGGLNASLVIGAAFGSGLAGIGDLDGDGTPDLAVGASGDATGGTAGTSSAVGVVFILFLDADGTIKSKTKIHSAPNGALAGLLDNGDHFGQSITSIGDVDGDGTPDLAVGAPGQSEGPITSCGAVWILFMQPDGTVAGHQELLDPSGPAAFGRFGQSLTALGDMDADGVPDLATSSGMDFVQGVYLNSYWVLLLEADGTPKVHNRVDPMLAGLGTLVSLTDDFGWSLAALGDEDGDGVVDLAVGARHDDDGGPGVGALWILRLNGSTWIDQRGGLAGAGGPPLLVGAGTLLAGDAVLLKLSRCPPNALTWLIVGATPLYAPLYGGTLVPAPDVVIGPHLLDGAGNLDMLGIWPGAPDGLTLWVQSWIQDAAAPSGFAASNGLSARTPSTDG